MSRFRGSEIRMKSSRNSFTVNSDAAQTKMTTLVGALDVTEGVLNTPKAQIITDIPGTATNMMSGSSVVSRASSVATAEPSRQTTAETAAASAAGAARSTAGETIVSSETIEKVNTHTLPGTKKAETQETVEKTPSETVTTCTQIEETTKVDTLTNTGQKTLEGISDKSKTDGTIFEKPAEVSIIPKQESGTTTFAPAITATANIRSATPIPEAVTDRATNFIISTLKTSQITPENKATTKTRLDVTFRTAAVMTETKVDLTEGKPAPSTIIKRLKTAGTEPSKVETSEENTARPQKSSQAIKTTNAPTLKLLTMILTATGKQAKTVENQLSTAGTSVTIKSNVLRTIKSTVNYLNTISPKRQTAKASDKLTTRSHKTVSPCRGKCKTKSTTKNTTSRRGQVQKPLPSDKSFYSAITMGSILVICGLLALIVFIKDFLGPK